MRLGGKVDNRVNVILGHRRQHDFAVGNIALHKAEVGQLIHRSQVFRVARIGELVQADDGVIGVGFGHVAHEVAANEACPTRHEEILH